MGYCVTLTYACAIRIAYLFKPLREFILTYCQGFIFGPTKSRGKRMSEASKPTIRQQSVSSVQYRVLIAVYHIVTEQDGYAMRSVHSSMQAVATENIAPCAGCIARPAHHLTV